MDVIAQRAQEKEIFILSAQGEKGIGALGFKPQQQTGGFQ